MTSLLCALAVYILAVELDSGWLLVAGCALQVWGMIQLWKTIRDMKAKRTKRKHARARRKTAPAHKIRVGVF